LLGEETKGIPKSILKLCDATIEIPMSGKKESLNVSVAFGIAAFAMKK
jgi:23S rRNA (guanosine2251-2'-O)-methyltransferase